MIWLHFNGIQILQEIDYKIFKIMFFDTSKYPATYSKRECKPIFTLSITH